MSESFELIEPGSAAEYLQSFDERTQRRGKEYFHRQAVQSVECLEPGRRYRATVQGSRSYTVVLEYDEEIGWDAECTCPVEFDCKHAYAAMKAILAENAVSSVRNLSAGRGLKSQGARNAASSSRGSTLTEGELARQLTAALGRRLEAHEAAYVRKVTETYKRCSTSQRFSNWDFIDLGFHVQGNSWEIVPIWPAFPKNDHEFWLYVARAAHQRGHSFPEFLVPVTDLKTIEAEVARWQRIQDVNRWKQYLGNLNAFSPPPEPARGEADLRLVLTDTHAELRWKRPGQDEFELIKTTQLRQLYEDYDHGRIEVVPGAELLFQYYRDVVDAGGDARYEYHSYVPMEPLGRMLRSPTLHEHILTADGQPMARPADPLRWNLQNAADDSDDYRLHLVQADGSPLPRLLVTLEGHPCLYVTARAIFTGPPAHSPMLDVQETRIPAPALETAPGLELLHRLSLPLPERLRDRVHHVPMQVSIRCELRPQGPAGGPEVCHVEIVAASADGQLREAWNGDQWTKLPTRLPEAARPANAGRAAKAAKAAKPAEERVITLYDRSVTNLLPTLVEPLGLKVDFYSRGLFLRVTRKFPEVFAAWIRALPPEIKLELAGELASLTQEAIAGQIRLDVTETDIDWFDLKVALEVQDLTLSPAEIKLLLNAKGRYVRLKDKGWRRLAFQLDADDDERLARLGLNPHELTAEPQRLHALQLADPAAKRFLPEQQVEHIQRRAADIKARVTPPLPPTITADLRPYQRDGFHFLAYLATNRFGGILADDMGLGKTLQTLAWLVWLRDPDRAPSPDAPNANVREASLPREADQMPGSAAADASVPPPRKPSLVVCPKSVMDNWQAEAKRFAPGLRVKLWPPNDLDTFTARLSEADLHVLNYSQLRMLGESLVPIAWQAVILDEGQYIKNPSSQTAQIARALRAEHRLVLTGTPIENRLLDLWSLMAFAMPGILSSRQQFAKLYDAKDDPFARRRLAARVRPFLLRRTKSQVAKDLPERIEEDLFCAIEGEQKTLYRAELKRAQQLLLQIKTQKQFAKEQFHFLTSLLRLRQICCHPALVNPGSRAESAKVNALIEQLEPLMEEGNKVLVFSQFVEMLHLLKAAVAEHKWPQFFLAGDTENRGELVQQFQSTEGPAVFLISLKAGGFGLNLTAASYVVLFDPWWNPAVENQAIDRTHRIGQTSAVIAYRLLIKDSIEEKIRVLQKQKKALAQDVLGEEKFAQSLTLDDLHYLFAD